MPYCITAQEYTIDPKGHNNPDDFVEITRGEVIQLPPGHDLIVAGMVREMADSDLSAVVKCACGRSFWGAEHTHFTQARMNAALYNMEARLTELEEGTEAHTQLVAEIEAQREAMAAEQKRHRPVSASQADATAQPRAAKAEA